MSVILANPICRSNEAGVFSVPEGYVVVPVSEVEGEWLGDPDTALEFESWSKAVDLFKAILRCKEFQDAAAKLLGPELSQFFKWLPKFGEPAEDRHLDWAEILMQKYLPNYPNEGRGWYDTLIAGEVSLTFKPGGKGKFLSISSSRTPNPLWKDAGQLLLMACQGLADARTDLYCHDPIWDVSSAYGPFLAPALAKLGVELKPLPEWLVAALDVERSLEVDVAPKVTEVMDQGKSPVDTPPVTTKAVAMAPATWREDARRHMDSKLREKGF